MTRLLIFLMILLILSALLWIWVFNGIPGGNGWSPGLRQDISGMDTLPGQDLLIAVNDRGYLAGIKRYVRPIASILDPNALLLPATPIMLKGTEAIPNSDHRWDAEAVKCLQDQSAGIVCIVVSGKNHQAILISATSLDDARKGDFQLSCVMDFRIKDDTSDKENSSQHNFESVEWVENFYSSNVDQPRSNIPLSIVMIDLNPVNVINGRASFQKFRLDIPSSCGQGTHQVAYLKALPPFSIDLCSLINNTDCSFPNLSGIKYIGKDMLFLFTKDKTAATVLVSLPIGANKFLSQYNSVKFDVFTNESFGLDPEVNLKLEGVTCLKGQLWFGLDQDGPGGGVFPASHELSANFCGENPFEVNR